MHHHQEPIQEIPGDDSTPAPTSPLSSCISELDSTRPVSELESVSSSHMHWSSLHEAPAAERASKLPDVVENESENSFPRHYDSEWVVRSEHSGALEQTSEATLPARMLTAPDRT
jgi:hypothetical protein